MQTSWITEKPGGVSIRVRVKPRAHRNEIEGLGPDGSLVVRLTAPPVDNKANAGLIAFLAKALRLPQSAITITAGERARQKVIFLAGLSREAAQKLIR